MFNLQIVYKDPRSLKPRARNPRVHSRKQIEQLKRSISEFGFVRPVLIAAGLLGFGLFSRSRLKR